jgi:hypothetical protein
MSRITLSLVTVHDEVIDSLKSHPEARVRLAAWQEWERRYPDYVNGKVGSRPAFPEPVRLPFAIEGFEDVRVWSWEDVDSWRRTHVQGSRRA